MTTTHPRPPRRPRQRGSALTEFALVIPVMLAMIYGSTYLGELGAFRLKAQEIARFSAWSMAVRPMSDFDQMDHRQLTADSKSAASDETDDIYDDLDAAFSRRRAAPQSGMTMSATYKSRPVGVGRVGMVPEALNGNFISNPSASQSMGLGLLGIGNSLGDLLSGPFRTLRFNVNGEVTGYGDIRTALPTHQQVERQAEARAAYADLSRYKPRGLSIRDRESDGGRIQTVLITDPWRLYQGAAALPGRDGPYDQVVARVSNDIHKVGGMLGSLALGGLGGGLNGLGGLFGGRLKFGKPAPVVFSRPYVATRRGRPSHSAPRRNKLGQANVVEDTGASKSYWEDDGVQNFETMPLYTDQSGRSGGYLDALNDRGPNWMGCPHEQQRRCEDWQQ